MSSELRVKIAERIWNTPGLSMLVADRLVCDILKAITSDRDWKPAFPPPKTHVPVLACSRRLPAEDGE